MHATFVTLWLQVVQPLANVHETKWTPHVKRETDVAQSYISSAQSRSKKGKNKIVSYNTVGNPLIIGDDGSDYTIASLVL